MLLSKSFVKKHPCLVWNMPVGRMWKKYSVHSAAVWAARKASMLARYRPANTMSWLTFWEEVSDKDVWNRRQRTKYFILIEMCLPYLFRVGLSIQNGLEWSSNFNTECLNSPIHFKMNKNHWLFGCKPRDLIWWWRHLIWWGQISSV